MKWYNWFEKEPPKPKTELKDPEFKMTLDELLKKYSPGEIINRLSKEDVDWRPAFLDQCSYLLWLDRLEQERKNDLEKH